MADTLAAGTRQAPLTALDQVFVGLADGDALLWPALAEESLSER